MDFGETPSTTACHLVGMPFPGRGHINPLMNLCKTLVSRSARFQVTFVLTEEWLGLTRDEWLPDRFRFSAIPNVIPSEIGRAANYHGFSEAALTKMEAPFEQLLDRLDSPGSLIICDTGMGWAVRMGNRRNIPTASFMPMSASMFSVLYHFHLLHANGHFAIDDVSATRMKFLSLRRI